MFVSFIKDVPFKLIRYRFINQIYEKKIVYIFVSFLKQTSYYCYMRWEQKFGKFIAFSTKTTIHNSQYNMRSIKLWAKDYPHAANGFLTLKTIVCSEYAVQHLY